MDERGKIELLITVGDEVTVGFGADAPPIHGELVYMSGDKNRIIVDASNDSRSPSIYEINGNYWMAKTPKRS